MPAYIQKHKPFLKANLSFRKELWGNRNAFPSKMHPFYQWGYLLTSDLSFLLAFCLTPKPVHCVSQDGVWWGNTHLLPWQNLDKKSVCRNCLLLSSRKWALQVDIRECLLCETITKMSSYMFSFIRSLKNKTVLNLTAWIVSGTACLPFCIFALFHWCSVSVCSEDESVLLENQVCIRFQNVNQRSERQAGPFLCFVFSYWP